MNRLAKEQMTLFEPNLSKNEYDKRLKGFLKKYFQLREKEDQRLCSRLSLKQRKYIHQALLQIYKSANRFTGLSYKIINDRRTMTNQPIIFSVTHVGFFDIQVLTEAIKTHCYILTSGFECLQGTFKSLILALNGVIYFNAKNKSDRKNVTKKMISHLKSGGNLMYFPEAAWNLSPNLLVMPLYWGIIDIARKGRAIIIPVACEQYGKHFLINIGEQFDVSKYDDTNVGKTSAITDLRDTMATLKYEILETKPLEKRNNISSNYWKSFLVHKFMEWSPIDIGTISKYEKKKANEITPDTFLKYNLNYTVDLYFKNKDHIKYDIF